MPFVRMDPESFDEMVSEMGDELPPAVAGQRPSGGWDYQEAEAVVGPGDLGPVARAVRDALLAAGAVRFRVRYDGGYDEGFAHPDAVFFADGSRRPAEQAEAMLSKSVGDLRAAAAASTDPRYRHSADFYADAAEDKVARYGLDELAHELASHLLGGGFGTGEYQLYGAFTADLQTGEIEDDERAETPSDADLF